MTAERDALLARPSPQADAMTDSLTDKSRLNCEVANEPRLECRFPCCNCRPKSEPLPSLAAPVPFDEEAVDKWTGNVYDGMTPDFRREAYIEAARLCRRFEHEVKTLRSHTAAPEGGKGKP